MGRVASLLAVSTFLAGSLQATLGDEKNPDRSSPKRYGVLCRWIDADGAMVMAPKLDLSENQKGTVSNTTPSPFVTGVTPEGTAQRPHIVVIQDGSWIEVTVAGRQPDGATIDVTVERSKIGNVETKKIAPNSTVQIPHVDISKKRVIDFVKYGEILSIPLGEKGSQEAASRVELVIHADDEVAIPAKWTAPVVNCTPSSVDAKQAEVFGMVLASGSAKLRCERVSGLVKTHGHGLREDIAILQNVLQHDRWNLANPCWNCCPCGTGLVGALHLLTPMLTDPANVRTFETAVFGCAWVYSVELSDSPSLARNARLLNGVAELWDLTVTSMDCHYQLMHDLTKINVRHHLRLQGEGGGEEKAQAEETIGQDRLVWHLRHDAPGHATLSLETAEPPVFTVRVEEAASAIPALQKAAHVKRVLILGEYDEDVESAEQAKRTMQKALPNMKIDTFVFTGRHRPLPR